MRYAARIALTGILFALISVLPVSSPPARAGAEEPVAKPASGVSLTVLHEGNYTEKLALVTLYHEGKPVRSAELEQGSPDGKKVTWRNLAPGVYEVHFEAAGFKTFTKRVVLAEDGPEVTLHVQLDLNREQTLGGGPSAQELQDEIAQLKKAQAELREKVEQLQAEAGRSKK